MWQNSKQDLSLSFACFTKNKLVVKKTIRKLCPLQACFAFLYFPQTQSKIIFKASQVRPALTHINVTFYNLNLWSGQPTNTNWEFQKNGFLWSLISLARRCDTVQTYYRYIACPRRVKKKIVLPIQVSLRWWDFEVFVWCYCTPTSRSTPNDVWVFRRSDNSFSWSGVVINVSGVVRTGRYW